MEMIDVDYLREQKAELMEELALNHITDADMAEIEEEVRKHRERLIEEQKKEYAKETERINAKIELIDEMLEDIEECNLALHVDLSETEEAETEEAESAETEVTY